MDGFFLFQLFGKSISWERAGLYGSRDCIGIVVEGACVHKGTMYIDNPGAPLAKPISVWFRDNPLILQIRPIDVHLIVLYKNMLNK